MELSSASAAWSRLTTLVRDVLPLAMLAGSLICVPILILEPQGLARLRALERDHDQVEAENKAVEREISRLRVHVKLLKDDLATIEHVARTELGLVRKSEIIFQLPAAK